MSDKKKERGCNFSKSEVNLLMTMILQDVHIIENKKIDGATTREKKRVWTRITKMFNATYPEGRDMNSLKTKYENLKRIFKKKISGETVQRTVVATDNNKLVWYEEKLFNFLKSTITGSKMIGDSHIHTNKPLEVSDCMEIEKFCIGIFK